MNSDPRLTARNLRPGDRVVVRGWPPAQMEVIDTSDPSLVTLRAPSGAAVKIGRTQVVPVEPVE